MAKAVDNYKQASTKMGGSYIIIIFQNIYQVNTFSLNIRACK